MDGTGSDSDGHSAPDKARPQALSELLLQEKALKWSRRQFRQEQEANCLIEAGQGMLSAHYNILQAEITHNMGLGTRPAKQKGLEKKGE